MTKKYTHTVEVPKKSNDKLLYNNSTDDWILMNNLKSCKSTGKESNQLQEENDQISNFGEIQSQKP